MPPSCTAWFTAGFLFGFWFWHSSEQSSQPVDLRSCFSQLVVEVLLSRRLRRLLTRWCMVNGDIYNGRWFGLFTRLFERCMVKVWNGLWGTTVDRMCGVVLLLLLGEMKQAELVSATREDVFHATYAYSPRGDRSMRVGPGVREQAPLPQECSSLRPANK